MKRTLSSEDDERNSKQHLQAQKNRLLSLDAPVSPPQLKCKFQEREPENIPGPSTTAQFNDSPDLAAIEAGKVEVANHLAIYSKRLSEFVRCVPETKEHPRMPINEWKDLYSRNEHPHGRHFVIHQHDHPVAGPHYDLRLQFSESSSLSWAIMYGLPGHPNSQRPNRNATETRVHRLWDHLNESTSSNSGSMIIWDTGEYEVLPHGNTGGMPETDNSQSDTSEGPESQGESVSESYKLQQAFRNRKIRLRLHGTRLPQGYTICLRMPKRPNFTRKIYKGPKRRRRAVPFSRTPARTPSSTDSESEPTTSTSTPHIQSSGSPKNAETKASNAHQADKDTKSHSGHDRDLKIRYDNAYPGSSNTIGSIYQRQWFIGLDRANSGFEETKHGNGDNTSNKKMWTRKPNGKKGQGGFETFHVRGPEFERSVVTGRLGQDVLDDHAVQGFQPRKGWRPILN